MDSSCLTQYCCANGKLLLEICKFNKLAKDLILNTPELAVCGYTCTRGFTRTRSVPAGWVRVGVSRVGSGTGKVITGTGVPSFTRTDV